MLNVECWINKYLTTWCSEWVILLLISRDILVTLCLSHCFLISRFHIKRCDTGDKVMRRRWQLTADGSASGFACCRINYSKWRAIVVCFIFRNRMKTECTLINCIVLKQRIKTLLTVGATPKIHSHATWENWYVTCLTTDTREHAGRIHLISIL